MNDTPLPVAQASALVTEPGIYQIDQADYHRDPCPAPSLSSSIAKLLVRKTPRHAWQAHPRFGGVDIDPTRVMDDGSAVHAMMLGYSHLIESLRTVYGPKTKRKELIGEPVRDYKTEAAAEERDEIRGMGKIPVLYHRLPGLIRCKTEATRQIEIADDGPGFLAPGSSEVCIVWREDDVWLRCLVDRLPDDPRLPPYDLKCTEMSAAPGAWERRLQLEYAFQDAFYRRGIKAARGIEPEPMRFIVIELEPPHGVVINAALPALRTIAEAEVERAIQRWRRCVRADDWPLYPPHTAWVDAPSWMLMAAEDAAEREHVAAKYDPYSLADHPFPFA